MNVLSAHQGLLPLVRLEIHCFWATCILRYLCSALRPHRSHSVSGLTKACPGHTPSSPWPKTWDKSPRRFLLLYPFAAISTSLLGPTNLSPLRVMKTKADGCCNKLLRCCSYLLHSRKKKKKRHKVMLVFLTGSAEHFPLPSNMYNSYFLGKLLSSKIQLMVPPLWSLQN